MLTLWRSGGAHHNLHLPPLVPGFADQLYALGSIEDLVANRSGLNLRNS